MGEVMFMDVIGNEFTPSPNPGGGKMGSQSTSLLFPSPCLDGGGENPTDGDDGAVVASGLSD